MGALTQRWQRLSRRQQLILLIAGGALVLWGFDRIAFRPLLRGRLSQLQRMAREAEEQLAASTIASAQAASVSRAYDAYRPYITPTGSPEKELAALLTEVETAVRETGISQLGLRPMSGRDVAPERVSVTVETEASPSQLAQLLDRLQRSTQLLKVTELTVRVSENQTLRSSLVVSKLLLHPES